MKEEIKDFSVLVALKFVGICALFGIVSFEIHAIEGLKGGPWTQYLAKLSSNAFWTTVQVFVVLSLARAFMFYRAGRANSQSQEEINWKMEAIREAGSRGENIVRKTIATIVSSGSIGSARFVDEKTVLFKAQRPGDRTQEIDHLLITKFGIFLIETKNYGGKLSLLSGGIVCSDGEIRKNPLVQSASKVARAKRHLGDHIPVHAVAVFSAENVVLGRNFPADMVTVDNLLDRLIEYKVEFIKSGKKYFDVDDLRRAISGLIESDENAKHRHLLAIGQKQYCALQESGPLYKFNSPQTWRAWLFGRTVCIYCGMLFGALMIAGLANNISDGRLSTLISPLAGYELTQDRFASQINKGLFIGS